MTRNTSAPKREFCLEVARQMSDHKSVENLQAETARHRAQAAEIEAARQPGSTSRSRIDVEQH